MGRSVALAGIAILALATAASARPPLTADASGAAAVPEAGYLKLGRAAAPDGTELGINSQYLTLNKAPWLPVMGEIHFARLPASEWDRALARIKASGVDVVATYLFWNYHEPQPGRFDWSERLDVRRFVETAGRHGLKVILRLGPWAHGELRFGGIPDWVVQQYPLRGNDPAYLALVDRYWGAIGAQVAGLMWKDGGPVIGIQLENEYNLAGPGQGREHIAQLKAIALRHGFDVPFYTVTGWDGTIYPKGEVTPVFGGYPDEPWSASTSRLGPKETYAFRFDSRVSGNLGAQTRGAAGDADGDIPHTPFLGAEFGGGVPTMYRRRPVIQPDDIAAMLPVQLGSGVNLYGYYMYHGGSNRIGGTTLQESTATGGYNDLPAIDYDFQAPFGAFGQSHPVAASLRPFHYFLNSYGDRLAPMTVRRPDSVPQRLDDLETLRWSVRAKGGSAFVFVNNHVRQYGMAAQAGIRFSVALPGGVVTFPSAPVTVPSDAYFIWPIGLDLGGALLSWASAQPVTRIDRADGPLHVFEAADGIVPEFAFPAGTRVSGGTAVERGGRTIVRVARPGPDAVLSVKAAGRTVRILVLTQAQARQLWRVDLAGQPSLVLSNAEVVGAGDRLELVSRGNPDFALSVWPALPPRAGLGSGLLARGGQGLFTRYEAHLPKRSPVVSITATRQAGAAPPVAIGGPAHAAIEPYPETFGSAAAAWRVDVDPHALDGLDDAFLTIDWTGDMARLFAGDRLIEDQFYYGPSWEIGLRRHAADLGKPLSLRVMPLRKDAGIYLDAGAWPAFPQSGQVAAVRAVRIVPQYRLSIPLGR